MSSLVIHHHSACPIVATEECRLVRLVDTSGRYRLEPVTFTETIHWLRECEATVVFRHGGQVITEGSTFCDFYGLMSSFDAAVVHAQAACRRFAVGPASTLEVAVLLKVIDTPVQPVAGAAPIGRRRCWQTVPDDWCRHDDAVLRQFHEARTPDARDDAWRQLKRLKRHCPVSDHVAWSSLLDMSDPGCLLGPLAQLLAPADDSATKAVA